MKCNSCGVEVDLPFRCNYCKNYYCPDHRLPENHDCSESWRVKAVRSARATVVPIQLNPQVRSVLLPPRSRGVHFSNRETRDLVIGTALVTAAGVTFFIGNLSSVGFLDMAIAACLFSLGFILHELAHKYVAQGYGLWAEFRLNMMGMLLTAISILSPLKFIAPGAVVISGLADPKTVGRTAVAGPMVNLTITVGLLALLPSLSGGLYRALLAGASINAFLALFNLIPFWVLDGQKVYSWNRRYWAVLFVVALALTIYASFILSPL